MFEQIVFYSFASLLVLSALLVITVRNPVHAALFLVLSFFCSSAIWLLLQAEFLAIALVLVYVGAVMVLFLFVVMMLDINTAPLREGFARFLPAGIVIAVLMMIAMGLMLTADKVSILEKAGNGVSAGISNTSVLGRQMFTEFLYPFEIAGAILLVAIIAAITLTMRKLKDHKSQKPEQQVSARPSDRVRLVSMKSEKEE